MWCARRAVVLCILVACSRTSTPPPPAPRDAAGPRPSGQADLDGDGAADCWRTSGDVLSIQPGCTGASTDVEVGGIAIAPPPPLDTPAWTRAIANVLVGPDHVGCETPAAGCPPGDPGLRNWVERRTLATVANTWIDEQYTPVWSGGAPEPPTGAAMILDPAVARLGRGFDPIAADVKLVVWLPPKGELETIGLCDAWELVAGPAGLAAIDRATSKWSWALIGSPDRPVWFKGGDAQCTGDLIVSRGTIGTDTDVVRFLDPRTGAQHEGTLDQDGFDSWIVLGHGRASAAWVPTRAIQGLLGASPDELAAAGKPCNIDGPLLAAPPGPGCTSTGKDDLDGDGKPDTWTILRTSSRAGGTIEWELDVDPGDGSGHRGYIVEPQQPLSFEHGSPRLAAWVAHRLAGADVSCWPARKGCRTADPALRAIVDRSHYLHPKPVWQVGTPALPPMTIVLTPGIHDWEGSDELVLYEPSTPDVVGTAPVLSSSCDAYDVWTSPAGGAVVDRATRKWAWLYLAVGDGVTYPSPVQGGTCDDHHVTFVLADHTTVVADPKTGDWELQPAGQLEGAGAPGR